MWEATELQHTLANDKTFIEASVIKIIQVVKEREIRYEG